MIFDLLILDVDGLRNDRLDHIAKWLDGRGSIPMLLIADEDALASLRIPSAHASTSSVLALRSLSSRSAPAALSGEEDPFAGDDILTVDGMTINLATYQVYLDDEPVDLTLMEYSLLSFLATHPNRAYSREVLLHRVWGFEYCGGTRTVDVHIRRIRSKIGPQIAAHITTVRGVGYLFKE